MTTPSLSIVVCGWYFKDKQLYKMLHAEAFRLEVVNTKLFIASHKDRAEVPAAMLEELEASNWTILWFENEGWEWGAYQQFIRWQQDRAECSDYYLFLHDDIQIIQPGFIAAFIEKIQVGAKLIGNSPSVAPEKQTKQRYPEDVLLAKQHGFHLSCEKWKIVRGSCFFTTGEVARNVLGKMPVKKGKRIELANSSLRIFGALVTEQYGMDAICYLSDTPRASEYIFEEFRGGKQKTLKEQVISYLPFYVRQRLKDVFYQRKVQPINAGSGLRVNLGCGSAPLPGYFNVDLDEKYADMEADILAVDFEEQSVAEVMMIHVIEHIDYIDVQPFLARVYKWLKPGGQLVLEFPDLIKVCRWMLKHKRDADALIKSPSGMITLYGPQKKGEAWKHRWCWTLTTMQPLLEEVGFTRVVEERARFHIRRRDVRIVAVK